MGELLVEIMRPQPGLSLAEPGPFLGPYPSGAPGIFVDTVSRLGHTAAIISGVGDDDFGHCILNRLQHDGVRTDHVLVVQGKSTAVAFVTYFADGSRKFLFHWDGTPAVMARAPLAAAIRGAKYFHVMGCSLMANPQFRTAVLETVDLFVAEGAQITFDPNIRFELLQDESPADVVGPILKHCAVLFPGEAELRLLSGIDDLDQAAETMFRRYPLKIIVVKQGGRGCTVYTPESQLEVPAYEIKEVDPTGAGDCFDGAFLCGLIEEKPVEECARLAAAAGALNAQAFGPMEGKINPETVGELTGRT
jgi:sugar/nucleoside kinase (ribokinase family)